MVFIPLPWVEYPLGVDSSFIYCTRDSNIDKLTALSHEINHHQHIVSALIYITKYSIIKQTLLKYHKRTPSFARSNRSFVAGSNGRYWLRNGSSPR